MNILSYLIPQKIAEFSTKYNNDIRVNDEYGAKKLLVNGSVQSGRYIRKLWQGAFKQFGIVEERNWKKILVLGVGGGTVIELLHGQFPIAAVTAVDIDPVIINIAKKYFLTGDISYIDFIAADAKEYVKKNARKYDCVVIDLFVGNTVPEFVKSISFIKECKKCLSNNGILCMNYLQDREYGKKSEELDKMLRNIFPNISDFRMKNNRFFFAHIV